MFDISFGELMIVGVIALIVIGPQRLPGVARTLGHLVGRAQRYVNEVKRDIQKEIDLDELNKVKTQMETAARSVQASVQDAASNFTKPVEDAQAALDDASRTLKSSVKLDTASSAAVATPEAVQIEQDSAQTDTASAATPHGQNQDPFKAGSST